MNQRSETQSARNDSEAPACCDSVLLSSCCGEEAKPTCCGSERAPVVCGCGGRPATDTPVISESR
jgi:hypothetical protein